MCAGLLSLFFALVGVRLFFLSVSQSVRQSVSQSVRLFNLTIKLLASTPQLERNIEFCEAAVTASLQAPAQMG